MIQALRVVNGPHEEASEAAATEVAANYANVSSDLLGIPHEQLAPESLSRIVFYSDSTGLAADRFRYLRMRLQGLWKAGKLKKLLVTSPLPQDGKSTLVLNLATALAAQGKNSVLLLEGDLYHPSIMPMLGLKAGQGLAECLTGCAKPLSTVRRIGPLGWYLMPAGSPPENPAELLHGDAFATVIEALTPHFDWILIDSPPVTLLTDAIALARHADGSLLVVRAGKTPREAVASAVAALEPTRLVAVVLNGVSGLQRRYSKYYGAYRKASS